MNCRFMTVLLPFFLSFPIAYGRQFPVPHPPVYTEKDFPPALKSPSIPLECQVFTGPLQCRPDPRLEWQLEREYWALVQHAAASLMAAWNWKTLRYAELSHTAYSDRIFMLAAFGEVMIFRSFDLSDPRGLPHALKALALIKKSRQRSPLVPSSISMEKFLEAFVAYATAQTEMGDMSLASLEKLPDEFGPEGSEGFLVAAFGFMSLRDHGQVERGISLLDDCRNPHCPRTTSIAPYKMIGNGIALAEAHAALGQVEKARLIFQRTKAWGEAHLYPRYLTSELIRMEASVLDPSQGLYVKWQKGEHLGAIRLPLGPSQSPYACRMCHAGNEVPETYYLWKTLR